MEKIHWTEARTRTQIFICYVTRDRFGEYILRGVDCQDFEIEVPPLLDGYRQLRSEALNWLESVRKKDEKDSLAS